MNSTTQILVCSIVTVLTCAAVMAAIYFITQ